ncbi:MAG: hypothetical protein EA361_04380 [Bacteroidetes bacterium]|nr:MAG: hypothetical protein EA361_04380 [Bacteroidota bacterium]
MWMRFLNFLANSIPLCHRTIILILLSLVLPLGTATGQHFTLDQEFIHIRGMAGVDGLNNIYTVHNGVLDKHTPDGQVFTYSNRQAGPVTKVHFADPLNIMVFFQDFGHVVFLDKNLSEKNLIQGGMLHDADLPSVVCFSFKNGFWAWFPNAFQLSRFNLRGGLEVAGQDLSLEFPSLGRVNFMVEKDDQIFLAANGLWIFDLHANFIFRIPHIQTHHFQVIGNKVFYMGENKLYSYDFFLKQENVFLLPETKPESFFVKDSQTIFLQTRTSLKKFVVDGNLY